MMEQLISICVCTYKRPLLQSTLRSLMQQAVPCGWAIEVVIIDNDSEGSARTMVERFALETPFPTRYAIESRKGLSYARNRALDLAEGDWLAWLDDDERADRDWLAKLINTAQQYAADAVVGVVLPDFECPPNKWLIAARAFEWCLPKTGSPIGMSEARTGNAFLNAKFLNRKGLRFDNRFNTTGGEDSDFFRRLLDQGGLVVSTREAVVHEFITRERMTRRYIVRRALRVGEVYARVNHLHGGRRKMAADLMRAGFNVMAAGILTLISLPCGRGAFYRYYLLLVRNAGKFRYYFGLRPTEMYK